MDRGKSSSNSRGAKSKITQYPPDIFALGAKPSSSRDVDPKRSTTSHKSSSKSSSSSSSKTSKTSHTGSTDRKRDHSTNLTPVLPTKKSKVSGAVIRAVSGPSERSGSSGGPTPGTSSSGGSSERERSAGDRSTSGHQNQIEFWETLAVEIESCDLVKSVVSAFENKDMDKVVSYITGAIKTLRSQRYKPCKVLYFALVYLGKLKPSLFSSEHVTAALASILRRPAGESAAHSLKSKGNPAVPVLCVNLLLRAYAAERNWPDLFVRLFVDDALGDRIWVDHEECKPFVDNIITAFNTRIPPKSLLTPELSGALTGTRDTTSSPVPSLGGTGDDEGLREGRNTPEVGQTLLEGKENIDVPVFSRYTQSYERTEQFVLEAIKEQINKRQTPDSITRNFLRLLSATSGLVEIRIIAISRLEMWLHNPKLMRPAQELLAYLCCNCVNTSQRDVEVLAHLTKIRLKTKALVNVYLNCLRELVTVHSENLPPMLKHTIYNELSNSRNPNNMPMVAVMFQASPETSATVLAEIFQDLLINKDDYLRSLRALLREIVRVLRFDVNLYVLCRSLVRERKEISVALRDFEYKDRVFQATADLLSLAMFLGISPQVKEAAQLVARGDKKELATLQAYQFMVAKIQREAVGWMHESVLRLYRPQMQDFAHVLHKILFLEPLEQYYKIDMWPSESDRNLLYRLASEVPLLQATLVRILLIGISKEHPLNPGDALELTDQLIKRAAILPNDGFPPLQADKLDIVEFIFNLAAYHHPENMTLPQGYTPPQLAISNLYWKSWIMLLMLSAHNPGTFGNLAWKKYPMLRTFMEMCITNHFSYPPPTVAMGEMFEDLKNKELQICALEKQQILEFESHLAAVSTKIAITEQNSLLISQLMEMKPFGEARQPPQVILEQLHSLNSTHRMGHLLCRSRHPDFLLDIIQRQGSSQHMPWLADLVHNSEGALSHLPVQCLCEYLLISGMNQSADKNEKHKKHSQVLEHLQTVLSDPTQEINAAYEILEYFLRRLNSLHCASRIQAIKALKMILSPVAVIEEENIDLDNILERENNYWLVKQIPMLPHFQSIRPLIVSSLRQACQVETDPDNISSYILFLSQQTGNDSLAEMSDLVLDLAQLIVERATITNAVLPVLEVENKVALNTLHSLVNMFCSYLNKAKEPRQDTYQWSESQDQVLITFSNGDECTMHILVVHAMIILLTYGPANDLNLFNTLMDTWFPLNGESPKAFLVDTSEEALLIPDWLKLRMIRSNVARLVDAALVNLEPPQLVLFIQSFGIPVLSMSKLLSMLDSAVTVDQNSVGESVLDKCYMAQLVEVQHRRGATGGNIFVQVLQLQEPKLPDEIIIETGQTRQKFPSDLLKINNKKNTDCNMAILLLNAIFSKTYYEGDIDKDFSQLLKNLAKEINSKNSNKKLFKKVLEYFQTSGQSTEFINCLLLCDSYSCTLFRLILTEKNVENVLDLSQNILSKIQDKKQPLAGILSHFLRKQQKKNSEGKMKKEISTQNILEILGTTDLVSLERSTKYLVDKSMEIGHNSLLLDSISRLLMSDVRNKRFERTGLFVDWIAELEMEIVGSAPDLQMELLFSKNQLNSEEKSSVLQNQMTFRPYLLTLLTHRVSWRALHTCVLRLLSPSSISKYDPGAVLDFLWALTCNPKLWQGRDKFTPKNYSPENILQLQKDQILVLVDYILEEAQIATQNSQKFEMNSVQKIEDRLPLFSQCLGNQIENTTFVIRYLIDLMQNKDSQAENIDTEVINLDDDETQKNKGEMAEEFLILLYMKIPKIIQLVTRRDQKDLNNLSKITEFSTSVIDKTTHNLFTALASTPRNKDWAKKSQEFDLLARKMAATHPALVLRQLSMIAASLKGRTHLDFGVFKSRNHLNLFVQILGIVELLQPTIFHLEYRDGLEGVLMAYFSLFRFHGHVKELQTILGKFVNLLQAYISFDASRALKYLQHHAHLLNHLHMTYANLRPLRTLMSSISLPREENPLAETSGEGGEVLVAVARAPSPEPLPPNWNNLVSSLTRLQDDEFPNILKDVDTLSNRRHSLLENIVSILCQLILSPSNSVRLSGHLLLLRYLRHRPTIPGGPHSAILGSVLAALDSENSEIVNGVLDRLSDYVVCLQENAAKILEKSFLLGIKSNINTTANIAKAISVLNIQSAVR